MYGVGKLSKTSTDGTAMKKVLISEEGNFYQIAWSDGFL